MIKMKGTVACAGTALGRILVVEKSINAVEKKCIESAQTEMKRLRDAIEAEKIALQALYERTLAEVGEKEAAVFEVYGMLVADNGYRQCAEDIVCTQMVNAEYAVAQTGEQFAARFAGMDDAYMQERAADIKDITRRLINRLQGCKEASLELTEPVILVAEELLPSQVAGFRKEYALAFVTAQGGINSHTAILARSMGIPMLTGVELDFSRLQTGMEAIVNGVTGEFVSEPDVRVKELVQKQIAVEKEQAAEAQVLLHSVKGKETVTKSGRKIELFANAGSVEDVKAALLHDAEGIGLFRSEYLFMGRDTLPDEEEQFAVYKQIAEVCGNKKAIIRTMDVGADKQAPCFALEKEENPAMGYRGIRICLDKTDIFKTQLRAIYRAAAYGNLAVMYPMIVSTEEVEAIKQVSAKVKAELAAQGLCYKEIEEGIMIETPAAVLISDKLAEMMDFFSIGTNDLTQYTLAVDRQNAKLAGIYNPRHEAVLLMIRMVVENAHSAGKRVGICGELAADEQMTKLFVEMGVDELSVAPTAVLGLRRIVREME